MSGKYRSQGIAVVFLSILLIAMIPFGILNVSAATENHLDDFTSVDFKDGQNTTVEGWGEGAIELPKRGMTRIGICDFPSDDTTKDVAVHGNYGYVVTDRGPGGRLYVVNITDPTESNRIQWSSIYGSPRDICVSDGYAYISLGTDGFEIHNVTNPTVPHWISDRDFIDAYSIEVVGKYAYISAGISGLYILDISDPRHPTIVGNYTSEFYVLDVFVSRNMAFISVLKSPEYLAGVHIVNITNPKHPFLVGECSTYRFPRDIIVENGYMYAGELGKISVFDISDLSAPVNKANFTDLPSYCEDFSIEGRWLYLTNGVFGAAMIDIMDPLNPILVDNCETTRLANSMVVAGTTAYVCDIESGLEVIRVSDIVTPTLKGSYGEGASGIAVSGSYAFIAEMGLRVIDISDPDSPTQVDRFWKDHGFCDVFLDGNVAYIADAAGALQVVDISDPTNIIFMGNDTTPGYAVDVCAVGGYAYVADRYTGVQVYNVTNPTHPIWNRTIPTNDGTYGVFASDSYLYIADGDGGLRIFSIREPSNPTPLGELDIPGNSRNVIVDGAYAFVAADDAGLHIVNVSDVHNPTLISTIDTQNVTMSAYVYGDYCYIADGYAGLQIVNISEPHNPIKLSSIDASEFAAAVHVVGDFAYVIGGLPGLQIVEVMANRVRQYSSSACAQSSSVYTTLNDTFLVHATLHVLHNIPVNSSITYYLSPDGGQHWDLVTPGTRHDFTYDGKDLRWRANLTSSHWKITPTLYSLNITYEAVLNAPTNPYTYTEFLWSEYNHPIFAWLEVTGAQSYLIQIDSSPGFDSDNLINATVDTERYISSTAFTNGTWYWRVAAIDYQEFAGEFTDILSVDIGTTTTIPTTTETIPAFPDMWMIALLVGVGVIVIATVTLVSRRKSGNPE